MASNDNVAVAIDITADPSKAERGLRQIANSVAKTSVQVKKDINKMFDISGSGAEYRGLVRAATQTTRKYATATELARNEISNLRKQFKSTSLSATIFNRAMSAQTKIISEASRKAKLHASVLGRLRQQMKSLTVGHYALGAAIATAFAARGIKNQLDSASSMRTQIKLIVGEYGNVNAAMRKNFELAKKTYGSLDSTISAYARISRSTKQLNKSEEDRLQVVSNINKSISIGSKTAQEGANAVLQLGQGLSSDRLSGDELKSILENAPRLAQAIADGMGVSIGKLREMGAEGELTAERVFDALHSQTAKIDAEFLNVEKRIDQAMTGAGNSVTLVSGQLDKLYGISQIVVGGFDSMATAIEGIPKYIELIEFGFAGVAGMITASLIPSVIAIGTAVAASPLLPLILAGGAAALAINLLSEALGGAIDLSARLSDADMRLAKTTDIATQAQYGLTRALRQRGRELATVDVTAALAGRNEAQINLTSAREELAAVEVNIGYGHMSGDEISEWRDDINTQLATANRDLKKATSQYDDSMKNLRKIDSAEIIDFSGNLGKDPGRGAGDSLVNRVKSQVSEINSIVQGIRTPEEIYAQQVQKNRLAFDPNDQSDAILLRRANALAKKQR
ncbi:MAG: tape measure protein, partial [Alphaproteobacteria bacterium]|nr:tape measure protein [Alphaproteobacteria bacterium]